MQTLRTPKKLGQTYISNTAKDWFFNSHFLTSFLVNLSATFPRGERFFLDAVREFRQNAPASHQKNISAFIGQEAFHTLEHVTVNKHFYDIGYKEIKDLENKTDFLLNQVDKLFSPINRLAITVGLEHLTAVFANELLTNSKWLDGIENEELKELWFWHATEEVDHKEISYNVYKFSGGGYFRRVIYYTFAITMLTLILAKYQETGTLLDSLRGINLLFGKDGFIRNVAFPLLTFYSPSFSP